MTTDTITRADHILVSALTTRAGAVFTRASTLPAGRTVYTAPTPDDAAADAADAYTAAVALVDTLKPCIGAAAWLQLRDAIAALDHAARAVAVAELFALGRRLTGIGAEIAAVELP